jgi:PAS domain S-box-containing protein
MRLDYFTLFAVMGFIDFIIVIVLIYYIVFTNRKAWYVSSYLGYKVLESVALIGFGLRGHAPDFASVLLANIVYFLGNLIHVVSVVSFKGQLKVRFTLLASTLIILASVIFILVLNNLTMRIIVNSVAMGLLFILAGLFLFGDRKPYRLPILIAAAFIIFGIINFVRILTVLSSSDYNFANLQVWDLILVHSGMAMILISSFGFLLLLKEVDDSTNFRQDRLNNIAFDQSPVSIVITDVDGKIEYVNPNFSQLTGYSQAEVKGVKTNVLKTELTPLNTFKELWKTIKEGEIWRGEFINRKKNDEIYYEEAVIAPIRNERKKIVNFLAIKLDITQRKKDEALIQQRNSELSKLNSTKDRMFSIIAHDLKGPIGNLQQLLEIIDHDINRGDTANVEELLRMLKQAAKTSADLLENLLTWTRSQLNAISINPEPFNLPQIISDSINLLSVTIKQKKIKIVREFEGRFIVFADKAMTGTIVRNLLSNAIKFSIKEGSIHIGLMQDESETILSIRDNGVGIDEDRKGKLFDFAGNQSTYGTSGEKGTGLGLVLSKEFADKNNGRIWFESKKNAGSTFYVALPRTSRS